MAATTPRNFPAAMVMRLTTPAGKPASSKILNSAIAVRGVCSAGFSTTVHPAAKAGAIFRITMAAGKFQGVMAATTPTGCLITRRRLCATEAGMVSP